MWTTFQRSSLRFDVCIPCRRARAEFWERKIKEKWQKNKKKDYNLNVFFNVILCILECWSRTMYCDSCGPRWRAGLILPYQRMNSGSDLRPNPLFSCCTNRHPGDKDHAPSAQCIVGGETIKETLLINENKHPWPGYKRCGYFILYDQLTNTTMLMTCFHICRLKQTTDDSTVHNIRDWWCI